MFEWLKKGEASSGPAPAPEHALRGLLFGDIDPDALPAKDASEPWASFRAAAERQRQGDATGARNMLEEVLREPALESRQYLQAWHGLRALGVAPPPEEAKHVYGVVVDVPLDGGTDTLAAYEDHTARYLNHGGGAVIWENPDTSLDAEIETLLQAGHVLVQRIGPWEGIRPPLPVQQARISVLTPSGLHFGQAPFSVLRSDLLALPVIDAATKLMLALVHKTDKTR